jgi:AraC-like DNA-binding protein
MTDGSLEIPLEILREQSNVSVCPVNLPESSLKPLSLTIYQVLVHIDRNYHTPAIWLDNVASHMGIHPDYLGRRFKRELGIRFHDYLLLKRMQRAIPLLTHSSKSIKEISYEVGFSSPVIFSKVFKRVMGDSPRTYRVQNGSRHQRKK